MALDLKIITVKNKLKENTRSIRAISFQKYYFLHRPTKYPTLQNFFNGFFDILVPKALDKGVKHGNHCGIKHRGHRLLYSVTGRWFKIHEDYGAIESPNSCKVGATGTESFRFTFSWVDVQDAGKDESIRDEDGYSACKDIESNQSHHWKFLGVVSWTRYIQKRKDVAEVMVDDISATEGATRYEAAMNQGSNSPHYIYTGDQ